MMTSTSAYQRSNKCARKLGLDFMKIYYVVVILELWTRVVDSAMNTSLPRVQQDQMAPLYFTLHMLTMILVYFGNILTIIAVAKFKVLQTVTNMFTVSLSVSDLLVAIIMPYCCLLNHTRVITQNNDRIIACVTCVTIITISQLTSLFNLMAVAIDRYIMLVHCFHYARIMKRWRASLMITVIWLYTSSFSVAFILNYNVWHSEYSYCSLSVVLPTYIYIGFFVTNIIIVLIITICLQAKVFNTAHKQALQIAQQNSSVNADARRRENRVAKMMGFVLGAFLICWLPYTIMNVIHSGMKHVPYWMTALYKLSLTVLYSNSFMNPIIYGWRNAPFRYAFRQLLKIKPTISTNDDRVNEYQANVERQQTTHF